MGREGLSYTKRMMRPANLYGCTLPTPLTEDAMPGPSTWQPGRPRACTMPPLSRHARAQVMARAHLAQMNVIRSACVTVEEHAHRILKQLARLVVREVLTPALAQQRQRHVGAQPRGDEIVRVHRAVQVARPEVGLPVAEAGDDDAARTQVNACTKTRRNSTTTGGGAQRHDMREQRPAATSAKVQAADIAAPAAAR